MQVVRKQKRNKAFILLFFPIAAIIFLVGWTLSWIGMQKQPSKSQVEPSENHVGLEAMILEEVTVVEN